MKTIILLFFLFTNIKNAQWIAVKDIPQNVNVPSILIDGSTIYAGADSVIYISNDGGVSWEKSSTIYHEADFVSSIVKYNNKIYVGTYNYGVFFTSDEGNSWTAINNGLNGLGAKVIMDLQIRGDSLYAATDGTGIFVMNLNSSEFWQHFSNGLGSLISYNVSSLVLINNVLYAGAGGNGFYYTNENSSDFWTEIQYGNLSVAQLVFYDLINIDSLMYLSSSYGIYKSSDNRKTWSPEITNYGFIEKANFVKAGARVFAVLGKSVRSIWFEFDFSTKQWLWFDEQPQVLVLNTGVFNNKLFACSLYNLFYKELSTTDTKDPEEIPVDFQLANNYPNPFNPSTKITFTIPNLAGHTFVQLKVYDIIGNEITTLVNNVKSPGIHEVEFNGTNLTSGVYILRMAAGNFYASHKMLLLK